MEETLVVVDMIRRNFPKLKIFARARNRRHAYLLMDRAIDGLVRDTFHSSLRLSEMVLNAIGKSPVDALKAVEIFRVRDEQALIDSHAFYQDEPRLIQSAQDVADELASLFERDRPTR
jgi:voltage-gated potassium channel Kch